MPKEILDLIRAVNTYKAEQEALHEGITMKEFLAMMDEAAKEEAPKAKCCKEKAETAPEFRQHQGSYKVVSMDGTITAMEILSTDLVQVRKNEITLVWPTNEIRFTTDKEGTDAYISQEEFIKLAEFCLQ